MNNLKAFKRRVRFARLWRGLAVGGTVGALAAVVLAFLDFVEAIYTSWLFMGVVVACCAVVGSLIGLFQPVSEKALAESVDRRAGLKDRLSTALGDGSSSDLSLLQKQDAERSLVGVTPARIYPLRLGRWHLGLVTAAVLASTIFLLGNSPILLSEKQKAERAELQQIAPTVQRVSKPVLDEPDKSAKEKELSAKLQQYQEELKRGRIDKQEALQKANELQKQADALSKEMDRQADENMQTAKDTLSKMDQDQLEKNGMKLDPALASATDDQRQQALQAMQKQADQIRQELATGKDASGRQLSAAAKAALSQQLKALEQQIELTKKALDFLNRLHSQPEWKQIEQLMQQLAKSGKPGTPNQLTPEQIKEMIKKLEELADRLKSDKDMREFLRQLLEALKKMKKAGQCNGLLMGMGQVLAMMQTSVYGIPGPGNGQELYFANNHRIPLGASKDIKAKALPMGVSGERQEGGTETYVEIRGPSGLGSKTRVPYTKILPKYKREAEQALDKQQIPPGDEKRVRDYFDSLEGGGK